MIILVTEVTSSFVGFYQLFFIYDLRLINTVRSSKYTFISQLVIYNKLQYILGKRTEGDTSLSSS